VNGSGFVSGAQIMFGGTALPTTFVNSGSLTGTVLASQVNSAGTINVTVVNPGPVTSAPATFTVAPNLTGTPTITPPLQSSLLTATSPTLGNTITSGTSITGFKLYINGAFNVEDNHTVIWTNTVTNVSTTFTSGAESATGILSVTPTQIIVAIPSSLFSAPVTSTQAVTVTVTEQPFTSNAPPPPVISNPATFFIAAPLTSTGPALSTATLGVPYAANLTSGGTGPLTTSVTGGTTLPPGLSVSSTGNSLSGTPTVVGSYNFSLGFVDAWGNTMNASYSLPVVAALVPVISNLSPSSPDGALSPNEYW